MLRIWTIIIFCVNLSVLGYESFTIYILSWLYSLRIVLKAVVWLFLRPPILFYVECILNLYQASTVTPPTNDWAIPSDLKYCHYFTLIIWLNLFNFHKSIVCCQLYSSCFKNKVAEVPRGGHYSNHDHTYCLELPSICFPANQHHEHTSWDKWKGVLNDLFFSFWSLS